MSRIRLGSGTAFFACGVFPAFTIVGNRSSIYVKSLPRSIAQWSLVGAPFPFTPRVQPSEQARSRASASTALHGLSLDRVTGRV